LQRIVEQVRKLIALSSSPDEHEARSAAHLACKLIRAHNLHVDAEPGVTRTVRARARATRGPYVRATSVRGWPSCAECGEGIAERDGCHDADGRPLHGDCVPANERP
jgi:hypothetical protein